MSSATTTSRFTTACRKMDAKVGRDRLPPIVAGMCWRRSGLRTAQSRTEARERSDRSSGHVLCASPANALELMNYAKENLQADYKVEQAPTRTEIAGRALFFWRTGRPSPSCTGTYRYPDPLPYR
jgi:hypothetical protein